MAAVRMDLVNGAANTTLRMNDGTADSDGNTWHVMDLVGWGGMTPQVLSMKRMATDGNVITNATYSVRNIRVTGIVGIAAGSNAWEAIQMFETATDAASSDGKFRVYEPAGTRHALVRVTAQPVIRRNPESQRALNWSISYTAFAPALISGL